MDEEPVKLKASFLGGRGRFQTLFGGMAGDMLMHPVCMPPIPKSGTHQRKIGICMAFCQMDGLDWNGILKENSFWKGFQKLPYYISFTYPSYHLLGVIVLCRMMDKGFCLASLNPNINTDM